MSATPSDTEANDKVTVEAILDLTRLGLSPCEIAAALNIDASAADRVRKGGALRPMNFTPNKGRF